MHISIYVCLYVGPKGLRLKEFIMAVAICRLEIIYRKIKKRIQNIMTFHLVIFYFSCMANESVSCSTRAYCTIKQIYN